MNDFTARNPSKIDDEDVNLLALFHTLWSNRWVILSCTLISFVISIAFALFIAKPVFESSALLLPIQAPTTDQLGAAAALLGKKGNSSSADVDLYQSLLTSRTVIHKLLNQPFRNESDTGKGKNEPLYVILKIDTSKQVQVDRAISGLAASISVGSKESGAGGLLAIKFSASTPWLAQQIGNSVLSIGQEELRIVRIERSEVILSRLASAVGIAKSEWDSSAKALAAYKDRNRSISLPEQMLVLSRLEIEKQAKEQKYLLIRKEYDLQMIEKSKATPPMMILDPANLPSEKSKPKRMLIALIGLGFGFSAACTGLLFWKAIFNSHPS